MRYYLFVDESGDADLTNPDPHFDVFALCGIIISEKEYSKLDKKLKALKRKYFKSTGTILHFIKMRNKQGAFKIFQDANLLVEFKNDLYNLMECIGYQMIACVINKKAYREKYPLKNVAYEESLKFMCERSVFCLRKLKDAAKLHIVLEKRNQKKHDAKIKKYYTDFIKNGTGFMTIAELSICHQNLKFREKAANINGLQLADICAYPIARKYASPESRHQIFEILERKFYRSGKGEIQGYGLKTFP